MKKYLVGSAFATAALFALPSITDAAIDDHGSLKQGDVNSSVNALQLELKEQGYFQGSTGSTFGPRTVSAVKAYQLDQGISSASGSFYGVVGPQTLRSLNGSSSSSITSSSPTAASSANSSDSIVAGASTTQTSSSVVSAAKQYMGSPYVWGGTSPSGFDCSGFLQYAHQQVGKDLPRTVAAMHSASTSVSNPSVGDLVFFDTRGGPSHAGIYIGNNEFIHAGASTGVTISSMDSSYWAPRYIGAGRV